MTVAPGDVIRVTAVTKWEAVHDVLNVYHVKHNGTTGVEDLDFRLACADSLDDSYAHIVPRQEDNLLYVNIEFYNLTQDVPILPIEWPTLTVGGVVGQGLPLQSAALVNFRTLAKRSVGRKYIGGFDETFQDFGGNLTAPAVGSMEAYADELLLGFAVDTNGFTYGNYRPATAAFNEWATREVAPIMATQRRRRKGVGA